MKQVEVTILGQSYLLGCPEGGDAELMAAVGHVDREMSAIRDGGKVRARERIAVLAALNLAYALAGQVAESPTAVSQETFTAVPVDTTDSVPRVDLATLIARIDQALSADGQLL